MALFSVANLQAITDHYAAMFERERSGIGLLANQSSPVAPTDQNLANKVVNAILAIQDYEQEVDLLTAAQTVLNNTNVETFAGTQFAGILNSISSHCATRGSEVNASINSLSTYLAYYNAGGGGSAFANMLAWSFGDLWFALKQSRILNVVSGTGNGAIMSPYIGPTNGQNSGLGTQTVGGSYVSGAAPDLTKYSEVQACAVVTTNFSGGAAPPSITVSGTDNTGATGTTWTGTFSGNNPTAAISQQTVSSGSITAQTRTTVTVGTTAGIAVGSVLTVNSGQADQELIMVEAVPSGTTLTAVFQKAHLASATLNGNTTILLSPSVSGRRIRSVSNVVLGLSSHGAGAVRVDGVQDRVAI